MRIELEKKECARDLHAGDIIVAKNSSNQTSYFLIVKNNPMENYTVMNLETNNLLSTITGLSPQGVLRKLTYRLGLALDRIIYQEEYKLVSDN